MAYPRKNLCGVFSSGRRFSELSREKRAKGKSKTKDKTTGFYAWLLINKINKEKVRSFFFSFLLPVSFGFVYLLIFLFSILKGEKNFDRNDYLLTASTCFLSIFYWNSRFRLLNFDFSHYVLNFSYPHRLPLPPPPPPLLSSSSFVTMFNDTFFSSYHENQQKKKENIRHLFTICLGELLIMLYQKTRKW